MEICQSHLPAPQWSLLQASRLPGVRPAPPSSWLTIDDAYHAQISHKAQLLRARQKDVLAMPDGTLDMCNECLSLVVEDLGKHPEFKVTQEGVMCPGERYVALNRAQPLEALSQLVQEDFCFLERAGDEHVLRAALLTFPASWRLSEKLGYPLTNVHDPVESYDRDLARRVQRLFDALRPDQLLERANGLLYTDPELFQPNRKPEWQPQNGDVWLRSERQVLRRLPMSNAVVFTIHTCVVPFAALSAAQQLWLHGRHSPHS